MQVGSLESFYLGISKTNKMIPINQTVSVKWMLDRVPRACSKIEFRFPLQKKLAGQLRPTSLRVDGA